MRCLPLLAALISTSAAAGEVPTTITGEIPYGCADHATFATIISLSASRETVKGSLQMLSSRLKSGECVMLKPGEAVTAIEADMRNGDILIRRGGSLLWTAISFTGLAPR